MTNTELDEVLGFNTPSVIIVEAVDKIDDELENESLSAKCKKELLIKKDVLLKCRDLLSWYSKSKLPKGKVTSFVDEVVGKEVK